jgi:hypothetical protein
MSSSVSGATQSPSYLLEDVMGDSFHAVSWQFWHWWESLSAVAAVVSAVCTTVVVMLTYAAIRQGQSQRQQANKQYEETRQRERQQHQDGFRPILVLVALDGKEPLDRTDLLATDTSVPLQCTFVLRCAIKNVGRGAALNVSLRVITHAPPRESPMRGLSPFQAGELRSEPGGALKVEVHTSMTFNYQDASMAPNASWTLLLQYQDMFGNEFHTIHRKDPRQPWAKLGIGDFLDLPPARPPAPGFVSAYRRKLIQRLNTDKEDHAEQ